jgi:hypothetical protein
MDKEKLIEWIKANERKVDGSIYADEIIEAIRNKTFDKDPCILCSDMRNEIQGILITDFLHCPFCGRKLEETK